MRSNPGDLPQELQHRPQNCPSVTIHLNEGISLMVGMGGGGQAVGSQFRSRDLNWKIRDCPILQHPFQQASNHPRNNDLPSTVCGQALC